MQNLEQTLKILANVLMVVSGLCLVLMMLHVVTDVSSKTIFGTPVPGTAEIVARYYMLGAVFLPLPLVELRNNSIVVDLFYEMFGQGLKRFCAFFAYLGQSTFFGLLAYRSFWDAVGSFQKAEFVYGTVPIIIWPASIFLPLGFGLAMLVSVLRVAQTLWLENWQRAVAPYSPQEDNPFPQEAA